MNDIRKSDEIELDIGKILQALVRNRLLILVSAAVGTAAAFLLSLMLTPKYCSAVTFYVRNNATASASGGISSADIAASKELVDSYLVILQSEETLQAVIYYAQVDKSQDQLRDMIRGAAVNSTEFFKVEVTSDDPREAEKIANAIGYILPLRIAGIMGDASLRIVDGALMPFDPSEPGYIRITAAGFFAGLALSMAFFIIQAVAEKTIRSQRDIAKACSYPVLARIRAHEDHWAPSYRNLRTRLRFTFGEDGKSRVIGVSSAGTGEGKSTVALHLASSFRRQGKRVALIDCDLQHSRLAKRQKLPEGPGLSDFLMGKCALNQTVRCCFSKSKDLRFPVVPAGKRYVKGSELLLSPRMPAALRAFRKTCDYVLLDLPGVGETGEAVELAKETDGVLLVVRQDKSRTDALQDAASQLAFAGIPVLGLVFNCAREPEA